MVNLTLRVLSRPDTAKLPVIVQNLGLEYDEKVLPSIDQFISCGKSRGVAHELVSRIWLAVLDNLEEFSRAVEQKQVAQ
ncbi:hypothetical protein RYX36_018899 [Vicia faba]